MSFFVETQILRLYENDNFFEIEFLDVLEYLENLGWVTRKRNNYG